MAIGLCLHACILRRNRELEIHPGTFDILLFIFVLGYSHYGTQKYQKDGFSLDGLEYILFPSKLPDTIIVGIKWVLLLGGKVGYKSDK